MGEAKRKREKLSPIERQALDAMHRLVDEGLSVEGGFAAFCILNDIQPDNPMMPLARNIFFSGAQHIWSTMFTMIDPGPRETARDLKRMDNIHAELEKFRVAAMGAYATDMKTKGSA